MTAPRCVLRSRSAPALVTFLWRASLAAVVGGCPLPPLTAPEDCASGLDEDGDGDIDCFDSDCAHRVDCRGAVVPPDALGWRHMLSVPEGSRVDGSSAAGAEEWGGDLDGDGHADLGFVVRVDEEVETEDAPAVGGSWVRIAPSSHLDGAPVDTSQAPVSITSEVWGWLEHGITTRCDLDGDGFDDLAAIDRYFSWYGHSPPGDLSLTIQFGASGMADPAAAGKPRTLTVPLDGATSTSSMSTGIDCGGDIDGDGLDELVVRAGPSGIGLLVYVLDSGLLLGADSLVDAIAIAWAVDTQRVEGVGDLDGDGFDDLWLPALSGEELVSEAAGIWTQGFVLPGGPHLAEPREFVSEISEEARPPVLVTLALPEHPAPEPQYGPSLRFGGESDDGARYVALHQADRVTEIHAHEGFHRLDGTIRLGPESRLARFTGAIDERGEAEPWSFVWPFSIDDIDGDGNDDILLAVGGYFAAPECGGPDQLAAGATLGFGVVFGGEAGALDDRSWVDVDVFVALPALIGGGWLMPDGDRDGDGLPDLAFWSLPDPDTIDSPEATAVGVLPGAALAAVR